MSSSTPEQLPRPTTDWLSVGSVFALVTLSYILHAFWLSRKARLGDAHTRRSSESYIPSRENEIAGGTAGPHPPSGQPDSTASNRYTDLGLRDITPAQREQLRSDKLLYHQLQNIEDYPDAHHAAHQRLVHLLNQTISEALCSPEGTMLDIQGFSPSQLRQYFKNEHTTTVNKYEAYLARRKQGGIRELFRD
ncbi:hypothetical protein EHS25_007084 [Saitozyma podzolica]|uniref:Uncharacterized protein n=1 Tax=Saitozyma podzolica TaxID=1890683 RepID=A0A427XPJ0_9TREE|nr:hypothetical protein EHS25_007084 [Saitozyma podzolica]